jgi:hypothetical protein
MTTKRLKAGVEPVSEMSYIYIYVYDHPVCSMLESQLYPTNLGKGKAKVKFSLEQAMKAQMGSRGIALLFL